MICGHIKCFSFSTLYWNLKFLLKINNSFEGDQNGLSDGLKNYKKEMEILDLQVKLDEHLKIQKDIKM